MILRTVQMMAAAAGRGGVKFFHTFDGAASTSLDATTPEIDISGNGWTEDNGQWELNGSGAVAAVGSDPGGVKWLASFDVSVADGSIGGTVRNSSVNGDPGYVFRKSDSDNLWLACININQDTFYLYSRKTGSWAVEASATSLGLAINTDYTIAVTLFGNLISATLDGGNQIQVSDSFNATATGMGLYANNLTPTIKYVEAS